MYNYIIIGGGPAGYNCALEASKFGKKVLLIENQNLGGTCLNQGCIPTKTLLHSSYKYDRVKNNDEGIIFEELKYNLSDMYNHKKNIIDRLKKGINFLIKQNKVDYIEGVAEFADNNKVTVNGESYEGEKIVIAVGTVPNSLPIKGFNYTINSNEFLNTPFKGDNFAIIGGGVIGVEFATILSNLGKSVSIFEAENSIISMMGEDLSKELTKNLKKKKVKIFSNTFVKEIKEVNQDLFIKFVNKDKEKELQFDNVISCVGRKPNSSLNYESLGVMVNNKGHILIDENYQTNIDNIYAIGDITGKVELAHFAEAQAKNLVSYLETGKKRIDEKLVPNCIYTCPEIASIGCVETNDEIKSYKVQMISNGKALINEQNSGFAKVFINLNDEIVGAELFMSNATEIITELTVAIKSKIKFKDFKSIIHPHPTVCESLHQL